VKLDIHPLTPGRWRDLVDLFARPGGSVARGCYCMYYRRSGKVALDPGCNYSQTNQRALEALVARGVVPGLLGYANGEAIAWVSLGPREDYAKLERSPVMRRVDDQPVWSIVCFFVDARFRSHGLAQVMLDGALRWARGHGVRLVEAYPCDRAARAADDAMWFGTKSMFDRAGFVEVARRKPMRPVMRRALRPARRDHRPTPASSRSPSTGRARS
jgi:GNAT superfamily N-acetyltransferase